VVGNSSPCVTYQGGIPEDFRVRSQITQKVSYPTLWQAQEAYYSYIYQKNTFEGKKRKLEGALHSAVKKAEKRLAQMEQKLLECEQAEELKLKGELITANLWQIERGMESFTAVNYYDENQATIKIALDKQLTPSQNAQKYYKKYAKQKRTISSLTEQKSEVLAKLDYLQSIVGAVSTADHLNDFVEIEEELIGQGLVKAPTNEKRKKKAIETPYRQYEFQSFKILAGRNNLQNERLVKTLSPEDIWLHTQKYHSSHVAILTEGRKVPDDVLGFAASVCAYYSDAKQGTKIPVDYTRKKYVKKPPKSAVGFVIYTDYQTVLVDPDPHREALL
jgi:predicted ribosome quality control (RQC) complex YloA/Tae2 family protein